MSSILLAFGIQAAWDGRGEAQRRTALLTGLSSDMAVARAEVDRVVGYHTLGRESAVALLDLGPRSPLTETSAFLVDSLTSYVLGSTASYDAPLGTVDGVIGSGELALLEDAQLAVDLAAFPALVGGLEREQRLLHSVALNFSEHMASLGVDVSHLTLDDPVPWEISRTQTYLLVGHERMRGLVAELYFRYRNSLSSLDSMREALDRIQSRLPEPGEMN